MTAPGLHKPWTAFAVAILGLGLTFLVATTLAGGPPVLVPDGVPDGVAAMQPSCGSCAARNQHVTRLSAAQKTGDLP